MTAGGCVPSGCRCSCHIAGMNVSHVAPCCAEDAAGVYAVPIPGMNDECVVIDPEAYLGWVREQVRKLGYGTSSLLGGTHTEVVDGESKVVCNVTGAVIGTVTAADDEAYVQSINIPRLLC